MAWDIQATHMGANAFLYLRFHDGVAIYLIPLVVVLKDSKVVRRSLK